MLICRLEIALHVLYVVLVFVSYCLSFAFEETYIIRNNEHFKDS